MPEIGTSGSMSGDGKRGAAEWPKLPRPSSTLPFRTWPRWRTMSAVGGTAEVVARLVSIIDGVARFHGSKSENISNVDDDCQ